MRLAEGWNAFQPMRTVQSQQMTILFAVSCHGNCKMPYKGHVQAVRVSTKPRYSSRAGDGLLLFWAGTCGYGLSFVSSRISLSRLSRLEVVSRTTVTTFFENSAVHVSRRGKLLHWATHHQRSILAQDLSLATPPTCTLDGIWEM